MVIAKAVRSLPRKHRRRGILLGSAAAVLLRVVAAFFVAQLLRAPYVKLVGGLLSMLMDRYPVVIYAGAAILGKVAAEMAPTDPVVAAVFPLPPRALWVAEALTAAGVIAAGKLRLRWLASRAERRERSAAAESCRNPEKNGG